MKSNLVIVLSLVGAGLLWSIPRQVHAKSDVILAGLDADNMQPVIHAANLTAMAMGKPYAFITSGLDGVHSENSLHKSGRALDFRRVDRKIIDGKVSFTNDAVAREQAAMIRARLGSDYDVVLEPTHIHVEYDPKVSV